MRIKLDRPTKKGFKAVQKFDKEFDLLAHDLGGHPYQDPFFGQAWMFDTDAGPLKVHVDRPHLRQAGRTVEGMRIHEIDFKNPNVATGDITIYAKFEDAERASRMGITSPNGKWNFHLGKVTPDEALDEFRRRITPIRQRQTRHTSTR